MAHKNKVITNPANGQTITFLQTAEDTNGALLEMQSVYVSGSKEPPMHYHPYQTEEFTIETGEMTVRIGDKVTILKAGSRLNIPPNTPHAMWNAGNSPASINWQVRPALNMEQFFEQLMGLAADGKAGPTGRPPLLQAVLLSNRFSRVIRMSKPSYTVQKIIFSLLTPFAYLAGYRPFYKQYSE